MKKKLLITLFVLIMTAVLSVAVLAGCTDDDSDGNGAKVINIVVPDGSPAIALAKLINDNAAPDGYTVNYSVVAGATQISTAIANKTADIAIAPTNIGATIYNKTGAVKLYATVVQGALYMVGKESLAGDTVQEKLASLKGQTVFNIGQGGTPDLTFKYILDHYGIAYQATDVEDESYVALRYVTDGSELLPMLKKGTAKYGILGEPAVSRANANTGTSTVFDIQELWKDVTGAQTTGFPQASVFVTTELLNGEHAALLSWLSAGLKDNAAWAKSNPATVSEVLASKGSTSLNGLTSGMIEACNLDYVSAVDAKQAVNTYLSALYGFAANTVGGKMPDDAFYYAG